MKSRNKIRNSFIAIITALSVAVSFMPAAGQLAYAEVTPENSETLAGSDTLTGSDTSAAAGQEEGTSTGGVVTGEDASAAEPAAPAAETAAPETEKAAPAVKTTAPAPSFNVKGKVKGLKIYSRTYKSVQVSWTAYSLASGYELYRADKKSGKYKKIKTLKSCKYNDTGNKKLGKSKYYKVRAYAYKSGKKVYSAYSSILKASPKVAKPKTITTTGKTGSVKISWSGVSGATKYQVYRATSKKGKYKKIKKTKSKSYTDKSVSAGKRYYYKVRAYRKVKKKKYYSSFTSPVEGMKLLGNVGNLKVSISSKTGVVTASWTGKIGASGYQLQRKLGNGSYTTVATTKASSVKNTLTKSGTYTYRVRAYSVVNGKKQYGPYTVSGGRASALAKAQSWVGCKEKNGTHKKIIDVYNNYGPSSGKIGYKTPWCAAFVSAVAISTGNTSVIPVHSYCPTMLSKFESKTYNRKYSPQGADVVFFDWNANKVPDHVGMVEKTVGNNVTTIEGNYSDAVKRRTFKKGYSLLLAYGLPKYTIRNTVSYKAPAKPAAPATPEPETPDPVAPAEDSSTVETACLEIKAVLQGDIEDTAGDAATGESAEGEAADADAAEDTAEGDAAETKDATPEASEASEEAKTPEAADTEASDKAADSEATDKESDTEAADKDAEDTEAADTEEFTSDEPAAKAPEEPTDVKTAETIIDYIQEEAPAEEEGVEEEDVSTFNSYLAYEVCDEMDIDACVVTVTEADGTERSYNEVVLDGELYILDATEEGGTLEKFTPEEIN